MHNLRWMFFGFAAPLIGACGDDAATDATSGDTTPADTAPAETTATETTLAETAANDTSAETVADIGPETPPLVVAFDALCHGAGAGWDCGHATVPLDWAAPAGKTIDVSFLRHHGTQPARGQFWFLQGGPGGTAFSSLAIGNLLQTVAPDLDVYLVDARGLGDSTRLTCAPSTATEDAVVLAANTACGASLLAEWGADGLAGFSTAAAGRDVAELIAATRARGAEVYLLGVSYGTRWALRTLAAMREPPTGVILDSIVPEGATYLDIAGALDDTAHAVFDKCGRDATCSAKLGADPWDRLRKALDKVETGWCPTSLGLDRRDYARALAGIVRSPSIGIAPALAYRLERCAPADEAAIEHFFAILNAPQAQDETLFGAALYLHLTSSELWPATLPSPSDVAAVEAQATASFGVVELLRDTAAAWPRFVPGTVPYPTTAVPILAVNHTHDPATPLAGARLIEVMLTHPEQRFVEMAGYGHGMGGVPCAETLFRAFLANPYAELDTSCAAGADTLRFSGTGFDVQATYAFGASAWGDD